MPGTIRTRGFRRLFGMGPRKRRDHAFDAPYDFNDDEFGTLNEPVRAKAPVVRGERVEPSLDGPGATPRCFPAVHEYRRR